LPGRQPFQLVSKILATICPVDARGGLKRGNAILLRVAVKLRKGKMQISINNVTFECAPSAIHAINEVCRQMTHVEQRFNNKTEQYETLPTGKTVMFAVVEEIQAKFSK